MSRIMFWTRWDQEILEKEVTRATDKSVFFMKGGVERREARISDWYSWRETFDEAKAHLISKAEERVERLRINLDGAHRELHRLRGLKPKEMP